MRPMDQAEGLRKARHSLPAPAVAPRRVARRTLAVTSGKGGVGKTTVAANLAVSFARLGLKVLVLDADLGLASLDLALGASPKWDLRHVLQGERRIEEVLIKTSYGVHLLPACPGRHEMTDLGVAERSEIMDAVEQVAADYDLLLIDTGAGIGSNAISFASLADEILLVCTPDPSAMRDAYAMAKVLHRRSGVQQIRFVANQIVRATEGFYIHDRLGEIVGRFLDLDLSYLGAIPKDEAVRAATCSGQPYVVGEPDSPAAKATLALAKSLYSEPERNLC